MNIKKCKYCVTIEILHKTKKLFSIVVLLLKNKLKDFDNKLSEHKNMLNNNYLRIFDAGNYKLQLNITKSS